MKENNLLKDRAWIEIDLDNLVNNISEIKKIIPHLIGLSLTYLSVIYTREDYLFMNVLLLIMLILYIYKLKKKSLILIVFFIIVIPVNLLVTSLNQKYYGASTNNEIINSNFSKAYQNLMEIKPDKKNL